MGMNKTRAGDMIIMNVAMSRVRVVSQAVAVCNDVIGCVVHNG